MLGLGVSMCSTSTRYGYPARNERGWFAHSDLRRLAVYQ